MHMNREENSRAHVLFWGGWEITEPIFTSMGRFHCPCIGGFGEIQVPMCRRGKRFQNPRLGGWGVR